MATSQLGLIEHLHQIDPDAPLAERHLWLMGLLDWVRGDERSADLAVARVRMLLDAAEVRPDWLKLWRHWWEEFLADVDATPLLADMGLSARATLVGELSDRLRRRLLPVTPETADLRELATLLFPSAFDAQWLRGLDDRTLQRMRRLLFSAGEGAQGDRMGAYALRSLMDAMAYAISQISATGQSTEIRLRLAPEVRAQRPFLELDVAFEALRRAVLSDGRHSAPAQVALEGLREQLNTCLAAAKTVYAHLQEHGISVNIEFQLRQLRQRMLRVRALLLCLETEQPAKATADLLAHLVQAHHESTNLRALWTSSTELLAAKVTERNAETGEHYITRDRREYLQMLYRALGGGALLAGTTWLKLAIGALGLSAFWGGLWAGLNYALSFVLIMLLHWTVATKQPAMTAPALAAKLQDMQAVGAVEGFVDEATHLLRSQVAAVLGNVGAVVPMVLLLGLLLQSLGWHDALMSVPYAGYTLDNHHLLGATALFAVATGGLLFLSSIVAGWVENWFVYHRLDSVMAHHPAFTRRLGPERAQRWAGYWRQHISGYTANISLGLMLGLTPAFLGFFGIPFEVRHVTLVAGQVAAAAQTLGLEALHQPALLWALGGIAITGLLNVCASFALAFRVALTAQNVPPLDRQRLYRALGMRLLRQPWRFVLPPRPRPGAPDQLESPRG